MCALALAEHLLEIIVHENNGASKYVERFTQEMVRADGTEQTVTIVSQTETIVNCHDISQRMSEGNNEAFKDV
jgi:hypothetical protein